MDAVMLDLYTRFVIERHRVWERRQAGEPGPWSQDEIVARRKFTNMFRVLDPGSQFAVAVLNEPGLDRRETLARALLYRFTNLPSAWCEAYWQLGHWPRTADMESGELTRIWQGLRARGDRVFSGAYVILPEPNRKGDKVEQAVRLPLRVLEKSWEAFEGASDSMEGRYVALRANYGVGSFMALQVLTDWGYSAHGTDSENEFVAEGPGSIRGAALVDPGAPTVQVIRKLRDYWQDHLLGPVVLAHGRYRPLSLMDVQNTLCEFDKYHRYWSGKRPLPGPYQPAHPGPQPTPVYPPAWAERNH